MTVKHLQEKAQRELAEATEQVRTNSRETSCTMGEIRKYKCCGSPMFSVTTANNHVVVPIFCR